MMWDERAACRGMDTALFFPTRNVTPHEAIAACARCTVVAECLDEANRCESQTKAEVFGYRAGMNAKARLDYRRKLKRRAS